MGIVATTAGFPGNGAGARQSDWLEAAAAAAAVTRLMHDGAEGEEADLARALLGALVLAGPADVRSAASPTDTGWGSI